MNIKYIGATPNSNYKRYAVIQHTEKEEEKAERFDLLLNELYPRQNNLITGEKRLWNQNTYLLQILKN